MTTTPAQAKRVTAVVDEVLPQVGLAYATDASGCTWTVTKSMAGVGIASLQPGQRVTLTVTEHSHFSVASSYAPLD